MTNYYDFIIIGGGTAGCVLANRLSADPSNKVLLLEAGGPDHWWDFRIHMPAALSLPMGNPRLDWCYRTEPEPHLNGRRLAHARGKVLGGSSSINGMIFQRGNPLDYEGWAQAPGMGEWSYAHCLPYFKRAETQVDTITNECSEAHQQALRFRGKTGPVKIECGPCRTDLFQAFFEAAKQSGYQKLSDLNGYQQEGFAPFDRTIHQGLRQSAARCYLHPIKHRRNLHILCHAQVAGLILQSKTVSGVWVKRKRLTDRFNGKHIILSAGAFNTPAILQRSGIGPAELLRTAGIEVKHELAGVGENLQDHLEVYVQHQCKKPVTNQGLLSKIRQPFIGLQWVATKTGPASSNHFEAGGFLRSTENALRPDIMIHFLPLAVRYDGSAPIKSHGFQLHIGPTLSNSRGRLWVRNEDYRQPPAFLFNYLSTQQDKNQWVAAIRRARELLSQPAWAPIEATEISPGNTVSSSSDQQILDWVKTDAETALHPAGTCKLGTDALAVTNPIRFTVHGLEGLSVVDASLMPTITNANLSAPVYMMAEKAADALLNNTPLQPEFTNYYKSKAALHKPSPELTCTT
jgi:choline dehydrogenase